jgi:hypothetical protein
MIVHVVALLVPLGFNKVVLLLLKFILVVIVQQEEKENGQEHARTIVI